MRKVFRAKILQSIILGLRPMEDLYEEIPERTPLTPSTKHAPTARRARPSTHIYIYIYIFGRDTHATAEVDIPFF